MIKLPLVLFLTMGVCFPTFFLVQFALSPRPLGFRSALLLQLTSVSIIALTWSVLALPLGVLLASSGSYVLVKALVSVVAALGGLVGASFFSRAFRVLAADEKQPGRAWALLPYWAVFGLVGSQIAWNLRPFIGSPSQGFILFRELGGSLLEHFLGLV